MISEPDNKWLQEFNGKCVSCKFAKPCKRKHEMVCFNHKAILRGLKCHGWGGDPQASVHKLYGCVYWEEISMEEYNVNKNFVKEMGESW